MFKTASIIALLAVACLIAPTTAAAQRRQVKFGIGGGVAIPSGNYHEDASGEGFDLGWQGIAFLEFHSPRRPLGIRVDVLIGETPANDVLSSGIAPATAKMRMLGGNLDLIFNLPASKRGVGLYALAGVGYYRVTLSVNSAGIVADSSEDKFAWNAGGGLTVPVGRASMFVEVRYIQVETAFDVSSLPFISATAGFRLGGK